MGTYTQWSTLAEEFAGAIPDSWVPPEHHERIQAYTKYDQMYWNDQRQYELRVLDGEQPIYVPNARTIVDTTSHYLMKDINIQFLSPDVHPQSVLVLKNFLEREVFAARFQTAKHTGVAHGDFAFHLTANPKKPLGTRISLTPLDPSIVFPVWDDDSPDKMVACHLVRAFREVDETKGTSEMHIKKLTYRLMEDSTGTKTVLREEGIYNLENPWYTSKAKLSLLRITIPLGPLPAVITSIPVYWFKNTPWNTQEYGSSELRGIESILRSISQGTTDTQAALSLEGLGVYATDGGRPINDEGQEIDWTISPGAVMEVPIGSKFWRVQGVGSISPMKDQLDRLETKMKESLGITPVALGTSVVSVAASGIALAVQFTPTLAKITERDNAGVARLRQLFHDWKDWHTFFEAETLEGDLEVKLGAKLPVDRVAKVNELNNMLDRHVISTQYYRAQMQELGYEFPENIEDEIEKDIERAVKAVPVSQVNSVDVQKANPDTTDNGNQSNNASRPNESSGTEVDPKLNGARPAVKSNN